VLRGTRQLRKHPVYKNESPFVSRAKAQKLLDRFEYLFFLLFPLIQGWSKKKKIGKVARKIGKFFNVRNNPYEVFM
jgi:hypothetical protein